MTLEYVPEELKTKELCELAVKQNSRALQFVPEELKTKELCEQAINDNELTLQFVPEELKTPELCDTVVKNNGLALNFVPEALKTKELCEQAIQQDVLALEFVPEKLKTKELCELAVKNIDMTKNIFPFIPEEFKTKELYELASTRCSMKYIPKEYITQKMCDSAVRRDVSDIAYIPEEFKTAKLCLSLFEFETLESGNSVPFIPTYVKRHIPKQYFYDNIELSQNKSMFHILKNRNTTFIDDVEEYNARKKLFTYLKNPNPIYKESLIQNYGELDLRYYNRSHQRANIIDELLTEIQQSEPMEKSVTVTPDKNLDDLKQLYLSHQNNDTETLKV